MFVVRGLRGKKSLTHGSRHTRLHSPLGQGGGRISPLIGGMRNMSTGRSKSPGSPTPAAGKQSCARTEGFAVRILDSVAICGDR